jgi:hypothetical protein
MVIAPYVVPQQPPRPGTRVVHADASTPDDRKLRSAWIDNIEPITQQVRTIQCAVHPLDAANDMDHVLTEQRLRNIHCIASVKAPPEHLEVQRR